MDKIPSFQKNHNKLETGLHECTEICGIKTWDLRFKKPNAGDYISPAALHTVEHLLATVLRNSNKKENVVYFGPMGCRTGFYLLTAGLDYDCVLKLLKECAEAALGLNYIPGNSREECGNYKEHDLEGAKNEIEKYLEILKNL